MAVRACARLLGTDDCNSVTLSCYPVKHRWDELGRRLDVLPGTISAIKDDNNDSSRRLAAMIGAWLRREKPNQQPSWRKLCEVLESMDRGLAEQIAKEHQCRHAGCGGTGGASYQQLKPSEINILPGVSAKDVLRKNSAGIITLIVDPTKLGNDLVEENLVAAHIVHGLTTLLGVTNYDKSTRLVNEVSRSLSVKNDPQILLQFLRVLQKQNNPTLNDIVDNILKEIVHGTIDDPAKTKANETEKEEKEAESAPKEKKLPKVDVQSIQQIFKKKEEFLKTIFSTNQKQIAEGMHTAGVIGSGVKEDPSYENICEEFFLLLQFSQDIEQDCLKFLSVLDNIDVPVVKKASQWLRAEMKSQGLKFPD